ncbi:phenylacetate--CoA ligase family protein [Planococcus shixiaomingii]|uniref:phenylacetate--CoA ligase family protein n=1 Tax=Planococcus shixiaomingii TaxID=3058393 RepID=UPI002609574E|nr:hypothetical protein [Planococcus sp. N022]WKA53872.1 hypothetical protein QWY21_14540 [Planococcus sp. N022]
MNELKMKIYENSPIFIQHLLTTIEGRRRSNKRFGEVYWNFLSELEQRDYTNEQEEVRYQERELQKLLQFAVKNSPFYKEFYKGIDIDSIKTVDDLKKLPLLTKEIVRQNIESMYTIDEKSGIVSHTSGTSGKALRFYYTPDDIQKRMAHLDFFKKQHGVINLKMKRASFSDSRFIPKNQRAKIFWRDNHSIKQRLYSAAHCQRHNAEVIAKSLNDYQPLSMDGLPSAIYEIAKWINDHDYPLSFQPIAIFTTAETLYPHYRKEIEKAFGCKIRDQYASSEGAPFIAECKEGNYHYNLNTGIVEIAEEGEIFVTCFNTYGTPLIRYGVGDRVETSERQSKCNCGLVHPVIKRIDGRTNDYLLSKNRGKFTSSHLSFVNEQFSGAIRNMQFRQKSLDTIHVLIDATEKYTKDMSAIIQEELEYLLGDEIEIQFSFVEHIPRGPNSKFRLIINEIE